MKRSWRSGISISYPEACISSIGKRPLAGKRQGKNISLDFLVKSNSKSVLLSAVCCSGIWSERCGNVSTFFTDSGGAGADRSRRRPYLLQERFSGCSQRSCPDSTVSLQLLNKKTNHLFQHLLHICPGNTLIGNFVQSKLFFFFKNSSLLRFCIKSRWWIIEFFDVCGRNRATMTRRKIISITYVKRWLLNN